MKELQQKQKIKRTLYSIPSLVLLTFIALILVKGTVGIVKKERLSAGHSRMLREEMLALTNRELELSEEISNLQTKAGIEEEIRERFSVIQEGEHLAIIIDERKSATSTDNSTESWYYKLWRVIIPFYE